MIQYTTVIALEVVDHPLTYTDLPLFHKVGDQYLKVEYLSWHTEGTTWIGGTLDVGFEGAIEDVEIDPYSYLYLVDQDKCAHRWEVRENGDVAEDVCKQCGKRQNARSIKG